MRKKKEKDNNNRKRKIEELEQEILRRPTVLRGGCPIESKGPSCPFCGAKDGFDPKNRRCPDCGATVDVD